MTTALKSIAARTRITPEIGDTVSFNGRKLKVVSATRSLRSLPHPPLPAPKPSKYGNRKTTIDGETFDSKREALRHLVLKQMQRDGEIKDLKRQVTFKLVVNGHKIGSVRPDWTYAEDQGFALRPAFRWRKVAEDAKGYQTSDHKTRWKLAKALHPEIEWRLS